MPRFKLQWFSSSGKPSQAYVRGFKCSEHTIELMKHCSMVGSRKILYLLFFSFLVCIDFGTVKQDETSVLFNVNQ